LGVLENHFDEWIAERYERLWPEVVDPEVVEPAVAFLAELADDGGALEFGVGTGRLVLPLSRRGVRVHGIDLSPAMVRRLRAHPGSEMVETTIGDFATAQVPGAFRVVYLAANTIMNLTTQDAQVRAFSNAAAHLEPRGSFVVEVRVPPWQQLAPGARFLVFDRTPTHLGVDEIDVATQNSWSHHYWFIDGETKHFSPLFRYVWPSELDLMARLAGMRLSQRWSGWNRDPFTSQSQCHISVWQKLL
jgi:cyclopropane fatty-acyl-phospholipid synthase-like methyltransferase